MDGVHDPTEGPFRSLYLVFCVVSRTLLLYLLFDIFFKILGFQFVYVDINIDEYFLLINAISPFKYIIQILVETKVKKRVSDGFRNPSLIQELGPERHNS